MSQWLGHLTLTLGRFLPGIHFTHKYVQRRFMIYHVMLCLFCPNFQYLSSEIIILYERVFICAEPTCSKSIQIFLGNSSSRSFLSIQFSYKKICRSSLSNTVLFFIVIQSSYYLLKAILVLQKYTCSTSMLQNFFISPARLRKARTVSSVF